MKKVNAQSDAFEALIRSCLSDPSDPNKIESVIQSSKQGLNNILNKMASTDHHTDMTEHVSGFVQQYIKNKTVWNRTHFNQVYRDFEDFLSHEIKQLHYFTPLYNIDAGVNDFEISDDIKIRKIKNDEKEWLLDKYRNYAPVKTHLHSLKYILVIKIDRNLTSHVQIAKQRIRNTIDTLRVFKKGNVRPGGLHLFTPSEKWNPENKIKLITYEPIRVYSPNKYVLKPQDKRNARELFVNVSNCFDTDNNEYLSRSIRRFSDTTEREDLGEKMVDFMVSLESILGSKSGDISFKLSQRSAILIGETDEKIVEYFEFIKMCYDVRSGIVHESTLRPFKIGNKSMDPKDVVKRLETLTRKIIQNMIKFFQIEKYKDLNQSAMIDIIDKFLLNRKLWRDFRRTV